MACRRSCILLLLIFMVTQPYRVLCTSSVTMDAQRIVSRKEHFVRGIEKNTLSPTAECHVCATGEVLCKGKSELEAAWCSKAVQETIGLSTPNVTLVSHGADALPTEACKPILQFTRRPDGTKTPYTVSYPRWREWSGPSAAWNASIEHVQTAPRQTCSRTKFLTSLFFGNHHNHLEFIIQGIAWARMLNRTYVLPVFHREDRKLDPEYLYSFKAIRGAGYCVIGYDEFVKAYRNLQSPTVRQYQLSYDYLKLHDGWTLDLNYILLFNAPPPLATPPLEFTNLNCDPTNTRECHPVRFSMLRSDSTIHRVPEPSEMIETIAVMDPFLGFEVRPTLPETIVLYSLLEPAPAIAADMEDYLAKAGVRADREELPLIALHLRFREGTCERELLGYRPTQLRLIAFETDNVADILSDCYWTSDTLLEFSSAFYETDRHRVNDTKNDTVVGTFLGYDNDAQHHVREAVEKAKDAFYGSQSFKILWRPKDTNVQTYARFHTRGELSPAGGLSVNWVNPRVESLHSLAVDFFVMSRGRYFRGNMLSSVSQHVCLRRLGRGLACNGAFPGYYHVLYHGETPL